MLHGRNREDQTDGAASTRVKCSLAGMTLSDTLQASELCLAEFARTRFIRHRMITLRVSCKRCCLAAPCGQIQKSIVMLWTLDVQASDKSPSLTQVSSTQSFTPTRPSPVLHPHVPSQQILQHFHVLFSLINFPLATTLLRSLKPSCFTTKFTGLFPIPEGHFFSLFRIFLGELLTSSARHISTRPARRLSNSASLQFTRTHSQLPSSTNHFILRRSR